MSCLPLLSVDLSLVLAHPSPVPAKAVLQLGASGPWGCTALVQLLEGSCLASSMASERGTGWCFPKFLWGA